MKLGRGGLLLLTVVLPAFAALTLRRPDVLLEAQFWAEDGRVFYAEAHNHGLSAMARTYNGYLHPLPRIVAAVSQPLPLVRAPLLFNVVGLAVQCLIPLLLISSRWAHRIPRVELRALLALLYVALPNCYEIHATATNAHWHLAPLACLVLLARPATTRAWRGFDTALLLLVGSSGPFCVPLIVICAVGWWRRRERRWLRSGWLLLGAGLVQLVMTLIAGGERASVPPEASPLLLVRILGEQVFLGTLIGTHGLQRLAQDGGQLLAGIAAFVWCGFLVARAARRGPFELRLLLLFAAMLLGMTLASPTGDWELLTRAGSAVRYWFTPALAFVGVLSWSAGAPGSRTLRVAALLTWLLMGVGVVRDFRYPPLADLSFPQWADRFEQAPPGSRVAIPLNPRPWRMELVKQED